MTQTSVALVLCILVAVVWLASIIIGLVLRDFSGARYTTVIMAPAASYLWGVQLIIRSRNGNGDTR